MSAATVRRPGHKPVHRTKILVSNILEHKFAICPHTNFVPHAHRFARAARRRPGLAADAFACCSLARRAGTSPLWLARRRPVPVHRPRGHDLDAVRARLQPDARLRAGCRRSATARSSASARTPSGCCSKRWAPTCGSTSPARSCSPRRSPARWSAAFISHRRGIYYALLTIAFGQVVLVRGDQVARVTGGEDGLQNIPRPPLPARLRQRSSCAATGAVLLRLACSRRRGRGLWRLVDSPFGRVLAAIKPERDCAPPSRAQRVGGTSGTVFMLSSAFVGLAGSAVRAGAAVGVSERHEPRTRASSS